MTKRDDFTHLKPKGDGSGQAPSWARALIVAELEHDDCDMQTDYFATSTTRRVALAWSKHRRDLFPELRKAAALWPETADMGPGCDLYRPRVVLAADITAGERYYAGRYSPWHRDMTDDDDGRPRVFTTETAARAFIAASGEPRAIWCGDQLATFRWDLGRESIEHREKYSMGHGYYLKAGSRYGSGWRVVKTWRDDGAYPAELFTSGPLATPAPAVSLEPVADDDVTRELLRLADLSAPAALA